MRKSWRLVAAVACCSLGALSLSALADTTTTSNAGGGAGGAGGSGTGGSATGGTATGGSNTNAQQSSNANNTDVTFTSPGETTANINYSGSYKLKNTPDVSLGGPASGPCNGFSGGLGVSTPGFAVGANTSTVDRGCEARETARVAAMLGRMDIANAVLENISLVQDALQAQASRQKQPGQAFNPVMTPTASSDQKARLKAQREASLATIKRQNTMNSANDTLRFTTLTSQGDEKTDQQKMWDEAMGIKPDAAATSASAGSKPSTGTTQDSSAPIAGNTPANGGAASNMPSNNDAGLGSNFGNAPQQGAVSAPTAVPVSGVVPVGQQQQQQQQPQASAAAAFVSHR